jgi:hypothetical protein
MPNTGRRSVTAMKKTGSDQTQPTVRITVEYIDAFETRVLTAKGTSRGGRLPTGVTYEWSSDVGPGLQASVGAGSDANPFDDPDEPCLKSLLQAGLEMLQAVASNVVTPAPAPASPAAGPPAWTDQARRGPTKRRYRRSS